MKIHELVGAFLALAVITRPLGSQEQKSGKDEASPGEESRPGAREVESGPEAATENAHGHPGNAIHRAVEHLLRASGKARERGQGDLAEELEREAHQLAGEVGRPRRTAGEGTGRMAALEERLAVVRRKRNELREKGPSEPLEKAEAEVETLEGRLQEARERRIKDRDNRPWRGGGRAGETRSGETRSGETSDEGGRGDRRGDSAERGPEHGPRHKGPRPAGPPQARGEFFGPQGHCPDCDSHRGPQGWRPQGPGPVRLRGIENLRHEIHDMGRQLRHIEQLIEELHRARAERDRPPHDRRDGPPRAPFGRENGPRRPPGPAPLAS